MSDPKVKKIKTYELPANSEQMTKYATMLDEAGIRANGIYLQMAWTAIERNDTSAIMDIIRVAQHKTAALRNVIFGITFKFLDIPITEPMGSQENIFLSPMILKWFAHLGEIPMTYFFIQNPDTGIHILMSDLILDGSLEVIQNKEEGFTFYGFQGNHINLILNRMFDGAIHFLEFCYGTEVDPRPHVEFAIKSMRDGFRLDENVPPSKLFTYEDIEKEWKKKYDR